MARDIKGLRSTIGRMVGQLYRRFDALARGRRRAEAKLRQAETEIDILKRRTVALENLVASPRDLNIERRITAIEGGRRAGSGVSDHGGLTGLGDDDHTQYQKESEKGATSGYASLDGSTLVPVAQMATGTPDGTKFLRDDRTWQTAGGAGSPGGNDDERQRRQPSASWRVVRSVGPDVCHRELCRRPRDEIHASFPRAYRRAHGASALDGRASSRDAEHQ
jgi:hypothetical protein